MGVTNLGRVQGGSVFYSTASSGTSIAATTLTPTNIVPLVGDKILFPNGDVRGITAVSGTTVTCSSTNTNLKGPQGAQGIQGIQGIQGPTGPTGPTGPAGTTTWSGITDKPTSFTPATHTHLYAGSSTAGGAATTALACTGNAATATTASACSGNAATATILQTTRAINGTNFNGSAAITTANWGTARNIKVGNTSKSVNGSADITWSLAEIGAQGTITLSSTAPSSPASNQLWIQL